MPIDKRLSFFVVAVLGIAIYYCEWLSIFGLKEACSPSDAHLLRIYVAPILISIFIGTWLGGGFRVVYWLVFIGPSFLLRQVQFFLLPDGPGNLWPLSISIDLVVTLLGLAAMFLSSAISKRLRRINGS